MPVVSYQFASKPVKAVAAVRYKVRRKAEKSQDQGRFLEAKSLTQNSRFALRQKKCSPISRKDLHKLLWGQDVRLFYQRVTAIPRGNQIASAKLVYIGSLRIWRVSTLGVLWL